MYLLTLKPGLTHAPTRTRGSQCSALFLGFVATVFGGLLATNPVKAVPVAADVESVEYSLEGEIPEEILRTEIITEARSPLTGEPLSAAEYAQLQSELADSAGTPLVSEDLRYLIFLLQFRRAVKPIIPFL